MSDKSPFLTFEQLIDHCRALGPHTLYSAISYHSGYKPYRFTVRDGQVSDMWLSHDAYPTREAALGIAIQSNELITE